MLSFQKPFKIGKLISKYFLHPSLRSGGLEEWKARLLVAIHLFILIIGLLCDLAANYLVPGENHPPLKEGMLIVMLFILIFKKWGSFKISGNLLAGIVFIVLLQSVFSTGGLYSDNLLWMVTAPLLALLFVNRFSGFSWLMALLALTVYLYILDINAPVDFYPSQRKGMDSVYFLISYSGLFIMVVGVVLVFATGQGMIIKALDEKQKELSRQKAELSRQTQSLLEAEAKILASNKELSQFASAAAHDLKEPLRMINMYTQLIKRKIGDLTDNSTNEYMAFVTDGVVRMERLLTDLLEYSRLGRKNGQASDINLNDTLFVVINNLTAAMKDTDAAILSNNLPVIKGTNTEMMQLFQNLIANSIKFRQKEVKPVIEISHHESNGSHKFLFKDNGIGIPDNARESVFNIFERLHSKEDYEGTGIGLATCKKIVNNLGGEIWVQPASSQGTIFCFTIPAHDN